MPSVVLATWEAALAGTSAGVFSRLACAREAAMGAARVWAVDLSAGSGGSAPKFYVVAKPEAFAEAYQRVPPRHRHAYEIIEERRGCFAFFDLDAKVATLTEMEHAEADAAVIGAVAATELRELAAQRRGVAALHVDSVTLHATRPLTESAAGKLSRHIVLRASAAGVPFLLAGPADAGAFAQRVHARLRQSGCEGAAALIDLKVYTSGRAFRLLGSTKLAVPGSVAFALHGGEAGALACTTLLATLVAPCMPGDSVPAPLVLEGAVLHRTTTARATAATCGLMVAGNAGKEVATLGRWWPRNTEMPLLDMPRLPHPAIACRASGVAHAVPSPLAGLVAWASTLLVAIGAGVASRWRYERAVSPPEVYLHVTGAERGVCAHVGRTHSSQHVMVSLDLLNGLARQRCWDLDCVCMTGRLYVKARHALGSFELAIALEMVPSDLVSMERKLR